MTRLLVIAPPDFEPLELLRREAPDVTLSIGTEADALRTDASRAEAILIAPSNPIASIGPIVAIAAINDAIAVSTAKRAAVSPIVGGASLQPLAGEMMSGLGHRVDAAGVANVYRGLIDTLVIDAVDAAFAPEIEALGIRAITANTIMRDAAASAQLARDVLDALKIAP